jgi:hypothetical protein
MNINVRTDKRNQYGLRIDMTEDDFKVLVKAKAKERSTKGVSELLAKMKREDIYKPSALVYKND